MKINKAIWMHLVALFMAGGMFSLWVQEKVQWQSIVLAFVLMGVLYGGYFFLEKCVTDNAQIFLPIAYLLVVSWLMLLRLNPVWANKQLCWLVLGMVALVAAVSVIEKMPKRAILKAQYLWYAMTAFLLLLPLLIGVEKGGATSWVVLAGFTFQPSELAKITFLLFVVSWYKNKIKEPWWIWLALFGSIVLLLLILVAQVDLGTALIFYSIFIIIMYLATGRRLWALGGLCCLMVAGIVAYFAFAHVQLRVHNWINPWLAPQEGSYQLIQSLCAFASGGWLGTGLGAGKPYLIPAAHTDFIFAVVGEQLGFIGCCSVVAAYVVFMFLSCRQAVKISTRGSFLLASGLIFFFLAQSMIIMGGVTKLVPLTGVTLPFVSYGGSSLVTSLGALGILLGLCKDQGAIVSIQQKKISRIKIASLGAYGLLLFNLFYWQILKSGEVLARGLDLL